VARFVGGNFWDGRAEGYGKLGTLPVDASTASNTVTLADIPGLLRGHYAQYLGPTADQALNPFPNGVEQNIRIKRVCKNVRDASYSNQYYKAYGEDINCKGDETVPTSPVSVSFRRIALALAAYQGSKEVSPFNSKRDWALQTDRDGKFPLDGFTDQENLGHDLFYGTNSSGLNRLDARGRPINANCAICHSGLPGQLGNGDDANGENPRQLYSDSGYHNIALPYNREIKQTVLDANGKVVANGVTVAPQEKKGLSQHVTDAPPTPPPPHSTRAFQDPDLAQRGQGSHMELCQSLHAQRLLQEPGGRGPLLQHAVRTPGV
jgi:cytochrome c peroxidase